MLFVRLDVTQSRRLYYYVVLFMFKYRGLVYRRPPMDAITIITVNRYAFSKQ